MQAKSDTGRLLIVHHTVSPALESMLTAVVAGAKDPSLADVEIVVRPALSASVSDVLEAGAYILGTPANIGYMSGALKHFFDCIYYPTRVATAGRHFGLFVHGNEDTVGATRAVHGITTGLGWSAAHEDVTVRGTPTKGDLEACRSLGATIAAGLLP